MEKNGRKLLLAGLGTMAAFVIWTMLIQTVDVHPVGQNGTNIGFAVLNQWLHKLAGVNMTLYTVTDWLGLVPIAVCMGFGVIGLVQLVRRKNLFKVDSDILLLGIYYILVIAGYLIFEMIPINYRPIPIEGRMEASYPSSTTLLVVSVMPTLAFLFACVCRVLMLLLIAAGAVKVLIHYRHIEKGHSALTALSFVLSIIAVLFLTAARLPYAVTIVFLMLVIKGILAVKSHSL